jgi:predicted nucleic acid-binding protein
VLVVDASAAIHALAHRPANPDLIRRLLSDPDLVAPHLLDIELLQTLRRLVRVHKITEERADDARADFDELRIVRYPHAGLADRIWALRHTVTVHDGAYVALAEWLHCPLITSDGRLGTSTGHAAAVEVYPHP